MNYNNEENRTPLDFKKTRRTVNKNHFPIILCIIGLVILVVLLFVFIFLDATEDVDSSKIEIGLHYTDIKVNDEKKCIPSSEAIEDASNIKLSYKKSDNKFYKGNISDLLNDDGSLKEVDDKDNIPGVDLVIEGITDNIYVYVEYSAGEDDCDGVKYTSKQAENGKIVMPFNAKDINSASVYVYSADSECDKMLKNYDIKLPMYNIISENEKCSTIEGKESAYCSEYTYSKYDESVLDKLGSAKKNPIKVNIPAIVIIFILFIAAAVFIYFRFN